CGACTRSCEEDTCPTGLTCVDESACGELPQPSCLAVCEGDADCGYLGSDSECANGTCQAREGVPLATVAEGPTEAGDDEGPGDDDAAPLDGGQSCEVGFVEYPSGAN